MLITAKIHLCKISQTDEVIIIAYIWENSVASGSYAIYDFVMDVQNNVSYIKSSHCPSNYSSNNISKNTTVDLSNLSSDNSSKNGSASGNSAVYSTQHSSVDTGRQYSRNSSNQNQVGINED